MGLDGAVAGGVSHAGEHEACLDLVVVKEALVALVNGAGGQLAGTGGAGTRPTGVGQIDALVLSGICKLGRKVIGSNETITASYFPE